MLLPSHEKHRPSQQERPTCPVTFAGSSASSTSPQPAAELPPKPPPHSRLFVERLEDRAVPSATVGVGLSGPSVVTAGSNVTYTVMVGNAGPDDAQNFSLSDTLPSGVTFVSQAQNSG